MARVPVYVIVGDWRKDSVTMEWDFISRKGYPLKQVDISVVSGYGDLVSLLADSFDIDYTKKSIKLSYWMPNEDVVFTNPPCDHLRIPPVDVADNEALAKFLIILGRRPSTNLYITVRDRSVEDDRATNMSVEESDTQTFSLSQDMPISESMVELIDRMEAEYRRSRGKHSGNFRNPSSSGDHNDGLPHDSGVNLMVNLGGMTTAGNSPCTPATVSRTLVYSPSTEGSVDMNDTPCILGRGIPTLEGVSPADVVGTSNWYRPNTNSTVNTPITPEDVERTRKGKGIYVPSQDVNDSLPCFDLGIDGLSHERGRQMVRNETHITLEGNVDISDIPTSFFVDPPPQMDYLPNVEEHGLVNVGSVFPNKKEFHMALSLLALEQVFCFKIAHSDKSRVYARCIDPQCGWRVSAKCFMDSENVEITKIVQKHTCGAKTRSRYVEKATARVLAKLLSSKFGNGKQGPRACEIPDFVLSELKVQITYMKEWYAKEVAVASARGKEDET